MGRNRGLRLAASTSRRGLVCVFTIGIVGEGSGVLGWKSTHLGEDMSVYLHKEERGRDRALWLTVSAKLKYVTKGTN